MKTVTFNIFLIFSCVLAFIISLNATGVYENIGILPISFIVISVLCSNVYSLYGKSLTVTLITSVMFLKNVLMPFFIVLGNCTLRSGVNIYDTINYAYFLEIYECLAVLFVLRFYVNHFKLKYNENITINCCITSNGMRLYKKVLFVILIIFILIIITYPQLLLYFTYGLDGDQESIIEQNNLSMAIERSMPRILFYVYVLFYDLLRWIIPLYVIFKLYLKNRNINISIFISLLIVGISAYFGTNTKALSVFIAISLSFLLIRLYPQKRNNVISILILLVSFFGIVSLFVKSFGNTGSQSTLYNDIASTLQAYFSGPENVAIASLIQEPISFELILGDTFGHIPFVKYFFLDMPTSNNHFNYVFWNSRDIITQIIPVISQGERYFSMIFAPIFTILIVKIALYYEKKIYQSNDLYCLAIGYMGCTCFSMALTMYNASQCFSLYFSYLFPTIVLFKICRKY